MDSTHTQLGLGSFPPRPLSGGSSPTRDSSWQTRKNILPSFLAAHPSRGIIHLWYFRKDTLNLCEEGSVESR